MKNGKKNQDASASGAAVCPVHAASNLVAPPPGRPSSWYTNTGALKRNA